MRAWALMVLPWAAMAAAPIAWPPAVAWPEFGVTNTRHMYHGRTYTWNTNGVYPTNEHGPYTHYINPQHPQATDTANPYGSPSRPRVEWPATVPAGSCVQIHGTNSTQNSGPGDKLTFDSPGTMSLPTFFYGTGAGASATNSWVDRREAIVSGTNVIVEGLNFKNAQVECRPSLKGAPVKYPVIRHSYFVGTGQTSDQNVATGFTGDNETTAWVYGALLYSNTIHAYGDWQGGTENDRSGNVTGNFATNTFLIGNHVYNMGGDGCRIGADQGTTKHNDTYWVAWNYFHHNRENAIDIKQCNRGVVANNFFHDFLPSSSSGGTAIAVHYDPNNCWIINNVVSNCTQQMASTGVLDGDEYAFGIVGNLLIGNGTSDERGFYLNSAGGTFYVANNTVAGVTNAYLNSGTVDGWHAKNNIAMNVLGSGRHFSLSTDTANGSTATNFIFWQEGGSVSIGWKGSTYSSVGTWISSESAGHGSVFTNPAVSGTYRLEAGSPAINAGVTLAGLQQRFTNDMRNTEVSLLYDMDGTLRGGDGVVDIGAFEFVNQGNGQAYGSTRGPGVLRGRNR
jgi:hypothetical protein